jgi:hypothetical protein
LGFPYHRHRRKTMSLIARDSSIYFLLDQPMTFGQHRGASIGVIIEEFPDYVQWLLDRDAIVLAGEVEETYKLALIKLENKERDGEQYDDSYDPFHETFGDDSIVDYLDS